MGIIIIMWYTDTLAINHLIEYMLDNSSNALVGALNDPKLHPILFY